MPPPASSLPTGSPTGSSTGSSTASSTDRRSRLFYLLYYAAVASLVPFLVVYYERLGLSGRQIGVLGALLPLASLVAGPMWSALADALGRHRVVALIAMAGAAASGAAVPLGRDFGALLPLVGAVALFMAPVAPLADSAVLAGLGRDRERYGRLRLWGAVGFGGASLLVGWITDRAGIDWSFAVYLAFLLAAIAVGAGLRWSAVGEDGGAVGAEREARAPVPAAGFRGFLNVRWAALLGAALLGGAALAVCSTFLYLYLAERGAGSGTVGVALAVATVSEIPVMFLASRWIRRVRPRTLLLTALGVFAVRSALYGTLVAVPALVAVQLLHGPSFGLLLVAGVARADRLAPTRRSATGQALFGACVMGLGSGIGALAGGALYDGVGPRATFLGVAAALTVATLLLGAWRIDEDAGAPAG